MKTYNNFYDLIRGGGVEVKKQMSFLYGSSPEVITLLIFHILAHMHQQPLSITHFQPPSNPSHNTTMKAPNPHHFHFLNPTLSRLSSPPSSSLLSRLPSRPSPLLSHLPPSLLLSSPFSSTPSPNARSRRGPRIDPRITLIRYYLAHPLTPRPLRFSRLRALRHWTIHRAAQLQHHAQRRAHEQALERQYNAIRAAMEELRVGVAEQDGGRLYRQAMQRQGLMGGLKVEAGGKGVGNGGVPLEYARHQVEGPSREGWDHGWIRA